MSIVLAEDGTATGAQGLTKSVNGSPVTFRKPRISGEVK
jgi:hypothetical protein